MNLDGAEKEVSKASKPTRTSKKSKKRSPKPPKEPGMEKELSRSSRKSRRRDGPAEQRTDTIPQEAPDARQAAFSDEGPHETPSKEPTAGAADVPGRDDAHPTLSQFQTSERRDVTASAFQPLILAQTECTKPPNWDDSQALLPATRDDLGAAPDGVPGVHTTASDEQDQDTDKEQDHTTRIIRHATRVEAEVEAAGAAQASGPGEDPKTTAISVRTQPVVEQPKQEKKPSGFRIAIPDVTKKHMMIRGCVGASCLLFAFILTVLWALGPRPQKHHYTTCDTLACNAYSRRLRESINLSVNPCDSFTHYVCDGWNSRYEASVNDGALLASLTRMYRSLQDIDVPKSGQSMLQSAAAFYVSCECIRKGECSDLRSVVRLLQEANVVWPVRAPQPDLLRTLLYLSTRLQWNGIISLDVFPYERKKALLLRPSPEFYLLGRKSDERFRSTASRQRYFKVLKRSFMPAHSFVAHSDVVTFEDTEKVGQNMLNVLWKQKFVHPIIKMNYSDFYNLIPNLTAERWNEALEDYGLLNPEDEGVIFCTNRIFFVEMFMKLWKEYGEEEMHLLLSWCTVQVAAWFADQELLLNFYGTEQKMKLGHRAFCFSKTFVVSGDSLLHRFSDATLPNKFRADARVLILDVRHAFHRQLQSFKYYNENLTVVRDWNSTAVTLKYFEEPKGEAKDLLQEGVVDMGDSLVANWQLAARASIVKLRSQLLSKVIQELELYMVFTNRNDSDMSLLPYAFSFPYFDHGAVSTLNYAGIGSHVAEGLSQLFFLAYILYKIPRKAFHDHAKCMNNATPDKEDFLANVTRKPIRYGSFEDVHKVSPDGHSEELFRENSFAKYLEPLSLKTALYAYRRRFSAEDVRVKGLEFLTPEQLFFVAACYVRCKRTTRLPGVDDGQCDMALMHVAEFAEAFKCTPDSPMNPSHRCELL